MAAKLNCWEATSCGREPGGPRAAELGICPAATCEAVHEANGGHNGGRICWAVCGTFCGGKVQNSMAEKRVTCLSCKFFDSTIREEGMEIVMTRPGQKHWCGHR